MPPLAGAPRILPGNWLRVLAVIGFALLALSTPVIGAAEAITVFAAASLKDAPDEFSRAYERASGDRIVASYAASNALAEQIENGAPADLDWMDYLEKRDLVKRESRRNLRRNRLVLIAPADSSVRIDSTPNLSLAKLLGNERLAMANPDAVPAGKYGRAALEALGAWQDVRARVAPAENVRGALALVVRGEAPLGIVYPADALADRKVKIVGEFPESTHPPIDYPVGLTMAVKPRAVALLEPMGAAPAKSVFGTYGF